MNLPSAIPQDGQIGDLFTLRIWGLGYANDPQYLGASGYYWA